MIRKQPQLIENKNRQIT